MEFYVEMKLVGDAYAGGFSCGLTMSKSETIEEFSLIKDSEFESPRNIRNVGISRLVRCKMRSHPNIRS